MRRIALLLLAGLIALPALAQESESYKLKESVLNGGGNPKDGAILSSASFRVKLDAIGEGALRAGLTSSSYRMDGGFVNGYPPPGEVAGFSFSNKTTLIWRPEKSIGVYNLYRDLLSALGGGFGACQQQDLTGEMTTEPGTPPVANGWFYLVTAENRLREEGTKGNSSAGVERPNPSPCP
jgi:hypothetical protein